MLAHNLKLGYKATRLGWNDKGMYIYHRVIDGVDTVWMHTADGKEVPWLMSQADFFATDWEFKLRRTFTIGSTY